VDNLTDHLYVKDAAGRYILDNPAHRVFLGVERIEEVLEKTVFDFFPTAIAERYHADDVQVIRTGIPLLNREERAITRAGEELWLLTSKVPFRDDKGQIAGLVCLSRNVTASKRERKEAEAPLV
jgi:PAS domain S-box-containing protein